MQISVLKKLLQLIKNEIPEEEKSSAETLEQSPEKSKENSEPEIQNSELENGSDEEMQNSECKMQNYEDEKPAPAENNRAHLTSSVPKAAKVPLGTLTKGELAEIRELFKNMDDNEIQRLYKKVTK